MNKNLKISLSFLLIIFIVSSCKKDLPFSQEDPLIELKEELTLDIYDRTYSSPEVERIFSKKNLADVVSERSGETISLEAQIANQVLYEIELEVPFIVDFLLEYGEPYWEFAYTNNGIGAYNVSIPIIKENEITSVFSFLQVDETSVSIHFNSVEFNTVIKPYDPSFTTNYISNILQELSIISGRNLTEEISFRDDCCTDLSVPTYATISGSGWALSLNSGSLCFCYDWFNNSISGTGLIISCCDNNEGPQTVDGGLYEAGISGTSSSSFPSYNDWIFFYTAWLEYWTIQTGGVTGGSVGSEDNDNEENVHILNLIQNEQKLLGWLTRNFLEPNFGTPVSEEYIRFIAVNPHIAGEIYKYLHGYYDGVVVIEQHAVDLVELLVNNSPYLELHNLEVQHILTVDPNLTNVIQSFLDNHPNDSITSQVIHDFISLEYCTSPPNLCTDYPSNLEAIYIFYSNLNQTEYDWLHSVGITTVLGGVITTPHEVILDFFLMNEEFYENQKIENIKKLITVLNNNPSLILSNSVQENLLNNPTVMDLLIENSELEFNHEEIEWLLDNPQQLEDCNSADNDLTCMIIALIEDNGGFIMDDDEGGLTQAEKVLIGVYPGEALKIRRNANKAVSATKEKFSKNGINDKSDAFRHAYFQALNTQDVGEIITTSFALAHESETPQQFILEKEMDIFNNDIGIQYGLNNLNSSEDDLKTMIYDTAVLTGELLYLNPINDVDDDPCFWGCPNNPLGTHGIIPTTALTPTDQ